jgi:hypothetical protein
MEIQRFQINDKENFHYEKIKFKDFNLTILLYVL